MQSSQVDPEEARRAARDILSGPEYAEPEESLVQRGIDWVLERLGDAVATLTGGGPGSVLGWIVVIVLVGAATWLVVRALHVRSVASRQGGDAVRYGTEARRDADAWLRESERLAEAGDHRGALRCRYQAMLARLTVDGAVDEVPGRTSGEYRDLLTERLAGASAPIDDVTARFEGAWYGGDPVDEAELARFADDCRRIETALQHTTDQRPKVSS